MPRALWPLLAVLVLAAAPARALDTRTLSHQGMTRSYHVESPAADTQAGPHPILLMLHGGGRRGGRDIARQLPYRELVRQGMIVVFPEGVDSQWNDGRGVSLREQDNSHIDDLGYLSAVIADVVARDDGDPARVTMAGASNGGMMTLRFACERAEEVSALAIVIASLPRPLATDCAPAKPLPLVMFNGTADPIVPYDGGTLSVFGRRFGQVLSTDATVALFRRVNRCLAEPDRRRIDPADDGLHVERVAWEHCETGAPVVLYSVVGGGHTLPGIPGRMPLAVSGATTRDINLFGELTRFLSLVSLNP